MQDKYIDISKELLDQRKNYVKYREEAARLSKFPGSQMGAAMAEYCKTLDAAIASVDQALKIANSN